MHQIPYDEGTPSQLDPGVDELDAQEAARRAEEDRIARLDVLGASLAKKRQEAIQAREALGIDLQWLEDLEFYEGIDDANRGEMTAWRTKPPGQSAPQPQDGEPRSTVFVNITRPYCDAAAARMGDMLNPTDDRAFALEPTPIPEMADLAKGKLSLSFKQSLLQEAPTEEAMAALLPKKMEEAKLKVEEAKERAEKAQKRIDDWHVECQYHGEVRKVIDDAAKLGTGVLKGPIPERRTTHVVMNTPDGLALVEKSEIKPVSKRVDPFNFFPAADCGENIQNGSHVWERDHISRRTLMDLREQPEYIRAQIDKCLEEGPQVTLGEATLPQGMTEIDPKDRFEIWYYTGMLDREDLEALGCPCEADGTDTETGKPVFAIVTMVNSRAIKGALHHLDTGGFPYDVMVWQPQAGKWTGIGVSRQIRTPQRMLNAAVRNMMDNAGISAGPQILVRLGVVNPADGSSRITPRKVWYIDAEATIKDVKEAFGVFHIESRQEELMRIIEFSLKIAEDVTGLPLLMQGQMGKAPDTLGGMQMLTNNANAVLRRLAKNFDDRITEPHVRRYYVWLMQYGDDSEKGDCQIKARGSTALVERDIQNQAVVQMGPIVKDPTFGINPKKWFAAYCRSQRLDPKDFQYTEEEQRKIDEQRSQVPPDPRIAVAQLRAQVDTQLKQMEQRFEANENAKDRVLEYALAELDSLDTSNMTREQIKAKLADTAMKLRTQRDLAANKATTEALAPPTEPPGKAPAGQAFQR